MEAALVPGDDVVVGYDPLEEGGVPSGERGILVAVEGDAARVFFPGRGEAHVPVADVRRWPKRRRVRP